MIPDEIQKVCEYLRDRDLRLPAGSGDTRGDSSAGENYVTSLLLNEQSSLGVDIQSANVGRDTNRAWYDVMVGGHYCDIKISRLKSADNTNAKGAIFYFLTGRDPSDVPVQESAFFPRMLENESPDEGRDFYYIIVGKAGNDAFPVTLKTAKKFTPSTKNPPFQCNWDKNREPVERSWQGAKDYLLTQWAESLRRLVTNVLTGMPKSYPQYFRDLEDILRGSG